jgi:hypothetical protein
MEGSMIQVATLLGSVLSGLRDRHYPKGNAIYAVRDGEQFLYIGQTRKGVWKRIRFHVIRAENAFGTVTRTQWLTAADWRVEVGYFGDEADTKLLETALIRRYCPPLNRSNNRGVPDTSSVSIAPQSLAAMAPSCQFVLAHGWPSFLEIALEPPAWQRPVPQPGRRGRSR